MFMAKKAPLLQIDSRQPDPRAGKTGKMLLIVVYCFLLKAAALAIYAGAANDAQLRFHNFYNKTSYFK